MHADAKIALDVTTDRLMQAVQEFAEIPIDTVPGPRTTAVREAGHLERVRAAQAAYRVRVGRRLAQTGRAPLVRLGQGDYVQDFHG